LKITDLLKLYREEALIQTIAEIVKPNEDLSIQLKGLSGSLDAVVLSAIYSLNHQNYLVVLNDKEEAAYFHNDLQNLQNRVIGLTGCKGSKSSFIKDLNMFS